MPTIRVTTSYGQCVYDADRVLRDSQSLVVEARRDHAWVRVGSFTAADVVAVDRLLPGGHGVWLSEDVRYAVGVSPPGPAAAADQRPRAPRTRWRRRTTTAG